MPDDASERQSLLGRWLTKAAYTIVVRGLDLKHPTLGHFFGGGGGSHAGKNVTVDSALQLATAWACIRLIAQTWGTLPVEVKIWDGKASSATRDHPLYGLLHDAPNADMTAPEFWSAMGVCLMTWGNAYAEIDRIMGRVVAITPLNPGLMQSTRGPSGEIVYRYSDPRGRRDIPEEDVLHIKGLSMDGLTGMSPISQARHSLGLAIAADETAGKLFANGLRTPGYLAAKDYLTEKQRADARVMLDKYRGAENAGKWPLLEGGWEFKTLIMPPQEAELLATRGFSVEEICRWYGVPPFMVGHTAKSTSWGTGLEQQMLAFHTLTLRPVLKNAEQAIRRRLLAPGERGRVEVDFNVEGLLRADSAGRAAFLKIMVECGIMTSNEARAKEGLAPLPGGDTLRAQSNQMPLDKLGEATSRASLVGHNGGPPLDGEDGEA